MDAIDTLMERFASEGHVERVRDGVRILAFQGKEFRPPLLFRVTVDELTARVRRNAEEAVGAFDDSPEPSEAGGWALLDIHLAEAIDTRKPGEDLLLLIGSGIGSVPG